MLASVRDAVVWLVLPVTMHLALCFLTAAGARLVSYLLCSLWSSGPRFWLHGVMDLKDIFTPWRSQFLDKFDVPVVFRDRYAQSHCAKTVEISQVQFLCMVTCPLWSVMGMMVQTVLRTAWRCRCCSYEQVVDIPVLAQTWWLTFLFTRSDEFQLSFWTAEG